MNTAQTLDRRLRMAHRLIQLAEPLGRSARRAAKHPGADQKAPKAR